MPAVPISHILDPAFADRYGVAASSVDDDLALEAVLAAAVELDAPLIVQTSLKTVKVAHGLYRQEQQLRPERVSEHVHVHPIPMVLHGGTGLTEEQFKDRISRGCAKVNISTALKIAFVMPIASTSTRIPASTTRRQC